MPPGDYLPTAKARLRDFGASDVYFLSLSEADQLAIVEQFDIPALYAVAWLDPPRTLALVARALQLRVDAWLSNYVPDPTTFRAAMKSYSAVISGSSVLTLIDAAADFIPNDIDVYVADHTYDAFCMFLITDLHGETLHHVSAVPDPSGPFVFASPPYDKLPLGIHERRVIRTPLITFDVLRSTTVTPLTAIAHFQSTHVMNFVGAETLVIAYPAATFERYGILSPRHDPTKIVEKYERRGYTLVHSPIEYWGPGYDTVCVPQGYCPRARRVFGDAYCLCLRWDDKTINGVHRDSSDIETAIWTFGGNGCGNKHCTGRIAPHVHTLLLETSSISPTM